MRCGMGWCGVKRSLGETLRLRSVARGTTAGGGMVDGYGN
jgi:hypothetical protein